LQTVVLDKGPEIISSILKSLNEYLDTHHIDSISTIIGIASRDMIPSLLLGKFMLERDTLYGKLYAEGNNNRCNGCGICERVCTEGAVTIKNEIAVIEKTKCRACNLCVLKCPKEAIQLKNKELLDDLIAGYKNSGSLNSFRSFFGKKQIGIIDKILLLKNLKKWGLA
jgi:MinD superfamily P-loop ATPase